jgi:hypothetical protein
MCCTGTIDAFVESHQQLGERFLSFRVQRVPLGLMDRFKLGKRVKGSMDGKTGWKAHLKDVVNQEMLRAQKFVLANPGVPNMGDYEDDVIMIANFISMLRTSPVEGNAESPELPCRLVQQLITLGHAHAMIDGRMEWNDSDMDLVRRVGVDTFPIAKRRMIQCMYTRGARRPYCARTYLLDRVHMRPSLLDNTMMQYEYMDAVEYDVDREKNEIRGYRLTKDIWEALDSTKFFKGRHMPG